MTALTADPAPLAPPGAVSRPRRRYSWMVRRLLLAVVSLSAISLLVFAATQLLPGNAAQQILGRQSTPELLKNLSAELGLDRPAYEQYLGWLGDIVRGDLGRSLTGLRPPVRDILFPALVHSTILVGLTLIVAVPASLVLGVAAAARRDGLLDKAFNLFTMIFTAVPEFVTGSALVIVFATVVFKLFPAVSTIPEGQGALDDLSIYVLPVTALVLATVPYLGRLVRASVIDELETEYVRFARFKGISERRILYRHALPNALVPTIQGVALIMGYLAGGIVAVEFVFSFPGIGTLLTHSISTRDLPTIQAAALTLAGVYIVVNLIADILVVLVTPRLRTELT